MPLTPHPYQDIKSLSEAGLILPEKCVRLVDILLGAQSLPTGGEEGASYARKVKMMEMQKPAASSSSSKKKKSK